MRSEGGGFAANIYGAMPESRIQVTSHLRLLIPSHSSLVTSYQSLDALFLAYSRPFIV